MCVQYYFHITALSIVFLAKLSRGRQKVVTWLIIRMRTNGALYSELDVEFADFEAKYTVIYLSYH